MRGVSESIIIGTPVPLGTGLFKVCMPPPTTAVDLPVPASAAGGGGSGGGRGRHREIALGSAGRAMGDSDALQEALAALRAATAPGGGVLSRQ